MAQQHNNRGLASANEQTRKRVASAGGKASRGGGRPSNQQNNQS